MRPLTLKLDSLFLNKARPYLRGYRPLWIHEPPIFSCSIIQTCAPWSDARKAAETPADPAPRTMTSNVSTKS